MNDIRKLIDILNETTVAGAVGGGPAVPLGATHKRMEEEQANETSMPEVIEYGNWENSALVTEKKTRSMRPKSKRIVKSVYGVDNTSAEGGEASESKEPQDKKKKVSESAQSVAEDQDLQEQDLIVNPAAVKKAMGIIARDKVRTDHEVEMARSDLLATIKNAQSLYAMLKDRSEDQGLEGWVQEKLIKANDYLNAVKEYYDEKMMQEAGVAEGEGLGYSRDPNQAKWYHEGRNAHKGGTSGSSIQDIAKKHGCPAEWLDAFRAGYQDQAEWSKQGVAEGSLEEVSLDLAKRARDKAEHYIDMDYDDMRDRPEGYSEKQRSKFQRYIDQKEPRAKGDRDWDPPKKGVAESTCPECGGPAFSEKSIAEAKDACYHKVKSRVKVWPSAYASGQLVQCRKRGAKNWGTGKK